MLRTTRLYLFASLAHLESICASLILLLGIWKCCVSNSLVHIYLTFMESSSTLNEQHIWGGAQLGPLPGNTSDGREQQMTNIVHRTTRFSEPPQGGFVASIYFILLHKFLLLILLLYQMFLLTQILVIVCVIDALYLHILQPLLLIITLIFLFLPCQLMVY